MALPLSTVVAPILPGSTDAWQDGSRPHGSALVTVGAATYDTDDFNVDFGSNAVELTDRYGKPKDAFGTYTTATGTCTMQIPLTSTDLPAVGVTFTADVTGATVWIITQVGAAFKKADFVMAPATFRAKLN
jgi:hypothetical protein